MMVGFVLMILASGPLEATVCSQKLPHAVVEQTLARIEKGYHLGTVIGLLDRHGNHYYGFGKTSLSGQAVPDENSIFEIGSITKTFTATLLANLDLKGEMRLQDPIGDYLPVFKKVFGPHREHTSLENLVTHTSGLPREPSNMDPDNDHRYKAYSARDLNDFLSGFSLEYSPQTYLYSNLGVLVLEHAIESAMSHSYESLLLTRVTGVLGMEDTQFHVPEVKRKRLVAGFRDGRITDELDLGEFQSMGGLRSTAKDMLMFLKAQLGLVPSRIRDAVKLTHRERYADDHISMSLGWQRLKNPTSGKIIHFHKGGTNGFVSFAGFNLEDQIGVVVLVSGRRYFSDLGFRLLDPTYPLTTAE